MHFHANGMFSIYLAIPFKLTNDGFVRIGDAGVCSSESPHAADSVEKQRVAGAEIDGQINARAPF